MEISDLLGKKIRIWSYDGWVNIKDICEDCGIEVGYWEGCDYTDSTVGVMISHDYDTKHSKKLIAVSEYYWDSDNDPDTMLEFSDLDEISLETLGIKVVDSKETRQTIQNFLNCCIMETQGKPVTHQELASLLDFYLSEDEDYWKGDNS